MDLETELKHLLNKHSRENHSNTPDWILAEYMMFCLNAFEAAVQKRAEWYGRMDRPGQRGTTVGCPSVNAGGIKCQREASHCGAHFAHGFPGVGDLTWNDKRESTEGGSR